MLYIFSGLPGTGKTAIARKAAERLKAAVLNEDEVLRELFPNPEYTWEERDRVYDELFKRAEQVLAKGSDLILDATFIFARHRTRAKNLAKKHDTNYLLVEIKADEENIKNRLSARNDDADFAVYLKYKQNQEPIEEERIVIENNSSVEQGTDKLFSLISKHG